MSEYDIYILLTAALGMLGGVSSFSAVVDGRVPSLGILLLCGAAGSAYLASTLRPEGMQLADLPHALARLVGTIIN